MAEQFKVGDRVRINTPTEEFHGKDGTILEAFGVSSVNVLIDGTLHPRNYFPGELLKLRTVFAVEDEIDQIASQVGSVSLAAQEASQAMHRWDVKTRDNTLGIDVGANAMHIEPSGALVFTVDGRIDIAFAPGHWTEVEYSYEETETKEEA